jgi:hypothetical protein
VYKKKFEVIISNTFYYKIPVFADNEDDAIDKAELVEDLADYIYRRHDDDDRTIVKVSQIFGHDLTGEGDV